jgi:hypothetical protein
MDIRGELYSGTLAVQFSCDSPRDFDAGTQLRTGILMYCTGCGKQLLDSAKFCSNCGAATVVTSNDDRIPDQPAQDSELTIKSTVAARIETAGSPPALLCSPNAPYAKLVLWRVTGLLVLSASVFDVWHLIQQSAPASAFLRPFVIALLAVWLYSMSREHWKTILSNEPESDLSFKQKHGRTQKCTVVIGIALIGTASLFGLLVGKNRHELQLLDEHLKQYSVLGDRISKVRNNVDETIAGHIHMYKAIEPDVQSLETNITTLLPELKEYDASLQSMQVVREYRKARFPHHTRQLPLVLRVNEHPPRHDYRQ